MKVAGALLLLVAGAATALATVAVHQEWWGLLLGGAATVATLLALPAGWATRLAFGLGWTAFLFWLVPARPEGDYAISSDTTGMSLLGLGLAVLLFSVVTLPRRGAEAERRRSLS
jgi:hypothetical protein